MWSYQQITMKKCWHIGLPCSLCCSIASLDPRIALHLMSHTYFGYTWSSSWILLSLRKKLTHCYHLLFMWSCRIIFVAKSQSETTFLLSFTRVWLHTSDPSNPRLGGSHFMALGQWNVGMLFLPNSKTIMVEDRAFTSVFDGVSGDQACL